MAATGTIAGDIEQIRHAALGRDVRDSIAEALDLLNSKSDGNADTAKGYVNGLHGVVTDFAYIEIEVPAGGTVTKTVKNWHVSDTEIPDGLERSISLDRAQYALDPSGFTYGVSSAAQLSFTHTAAAAAEHVKVTPFLQEVSNATGENYPDYRVMLILKNTSDTAVTVSGSAVVAPWLYKVEDNA